MSNNEITKLIHSLELACQLANTQQAEIERLKNELHGKVEYIHEQREVIDEKKAEIERLQKETECFADIGKMYSEIKAETIKEFAKRLKATYPPREDKRCTLDDCYTLDVIDNLVKEITEGENG